MLSGSDGGTATTGATDSKPAAFSTIRWLCSVKTVKVGVGYFRVVAGGCCGVCVMGT